jgi:multidrug efflux system membrane fusion protein
VQPITVIFTLAEDSLGQVQGRMRQSHTLPVDALDRTDSTKIASGKLFTIDNQIDTTTGTVKLRATFDNKNGALFPNQFVNTHLLVNTLNGVTTIPSGAIQHNGEAAFVFVVNDGKATMRNITTGASDHGQTAVQGLNPGEVVATSSFEKLQNGSDVKLAKQAPPANPAGSRVP